MSELICTCGLVQSQHLDVEKYIGEKINETTLIMLGQEVQAYEAAYGRSACFKFVADNLKYLERKHENRNR